MRHLNLQRQTTTKTRGEQQPGRIAHVDCQVCGCSKSVDDAIVLWGSEGREGSVVFAVCHTCTRDHDIVMRPAVAGGTGVQVLAKSRGGRPIPVPAAPYAPVAARRIRPQPQQPEALPELVLAAS